MTSNNEISRPYRSYQDIPEVVEAYYHTDIPLDGLHSTLKHYETSHGLIMDPDFQRMHVWTRQQQVAFVEHILRGGRNNVIRWNSPGWMRSRYKMQPITLIDGKQRLTAVLLFLTGDLPAYGRCFNEWDGFMPSLAQLRFAINGLFTREAVLRWYLEMNKGNVAHTPDEISRIEALLTDELATATS